jgi:TPR repeat protein
MRISICLAVTVLCAWVTSFAEDFAAGVEAYQKGDYATALKEWRAIADQGGSAAMFNIGLMYYDGHGVPQDFGQAAVWFERSAEKDYAKAQRDLGEMYAVGKGVRRDYVQAFKWLNICAAKGDETCASHRDEIAHKLKASKLAEAQRLSSEWRPKKSPSDQ